MFSDNFFKKVEKKTNVNKDTILSLADKLQKGNMKDEKVLKEVINDLAKMTGREVSKEKEQKLKQFAGRKSKNIPTNGLKKRLISIRSHKKICFK